jgi:glycosyltransferase involved in cell wall biosynthesis
MLSISIIIPCYNNESQLPTTCAAIANAAAEMRQNGIRLQLVFVDDASTDGTWQIITSLKKEKDFEVSGLRLGSNVGAYNAIVPGLKHALGRAIIVMAADGDDPPQLIPRMVELWKAGHDLVQAVRTPESRSGTPHLAGRCLYGMMRLMGMRNIPSSGCDFMLADILVVQNALNRGIRPGNTLLQLYQYANKVVHIDYVKGRRPSKGWTFNKKLRLFGASILTALNFTKVMESVTIEETI